MSEALDRGEIFPASRGTETCSPAFRSGARYLHRI
jgi:hypothetical protein